MAEFVTNDVVEGWGRQFDDAVRTLIRREGVEDLMAWLGGTDLYVAPASSRYHGAYEGGLVEHLLDVHAELRRLNEAYGFGFSEESMAVAALFHDLCKVNCYRADTRNVKDDHGVWHKVPCYRFDEGFRFGGHGSKSVYLAQTFINLTPDEATAINCHMGQFDATTYSNVSAAFEACPLAWALHVADEASTYRQGWGDIDG